MDANKMPELCTECGREIEECVFYNADPDGSPAVPLYGGKWAHAECWRKRNSDLIARCVRKDADRLISCPCCSCPVPLYHDDDSGHYSNSCPNCYAVLVLSVMPYEGEV